MDGFYVGIALGNLRSVETIVICICIGVDVVVDMINNVQSYP